jgi:hypothetical protein
MDSKAKSPLGDISLIRCLNGVACLNCYSKFTVCCFMRIGLLGD